jgi:HEAT repeat protein
MRTWIPLLALSSPAFAQVTLSGGARRELAIVLDAREAYGTRLAATMRLAKLDEPAIAYPLCESLALEDGGPKGAIRNLLVEVGAAEQFRKDLDAKDPSVRADAARMASCAFDGSTIAALVSALGDESPAVRAAAADSLAYLRASAAADPLRRMLTDDPDPDARGAAAQALGALHLGCADLERARKSERDDFTRVLIDQALSACSG